MASDASFEDVVEQNLTASGKDENQNVEAEDSDTSLKRELKEMEAKADSKE